MRVLLGRERAEVDAVHPVELRVVELRRARAHALEREPLDELVAAHDRRLAVGRPAEQREEVDERLGEVAGLAELVDAGRAVPLRELLPVLPEDVRHVRVDGQLGPDRADDVDLLRRVRDVVLAADHVRDPVPDVLHRRSEVVGRPAVGADDARGPRASRSGTRRGRARRRPTRSTPSSGIRNRIAPSSSYAFPSATSCSATRRQSSMRSSWKVGSPSQSSPSQRSDSWIWSTASATSRARVGVLDPEPVLAALRGARRAS